MVNKPQDLREDSGHAGDSVPMDASIQNSNQGVEEEEDPDGAVKRTITR